MAITYHAGRRIQGNISAHKVHTFTTTGNSTFQITAGSGNVEYLVVAGGAGGGAGGAGGAGGGGGGAGGMKTGTLSLSTSTGSSGSHTVTVGLLGAGSTVTNTAYNVMGANARGSNGGNSVFDSITSTGGGGGGAGTNINPQGVGNDGGSGGGDAFYLGSGTGISGQGNDGGDSPTSGGSSGDWNGGGGGGAGVAGDGGTTGGGGAGGAGLQSSINGTATYYAGGGGGAIWQDSSITGGAGGSSIGGAGGDFNGGGSDATGYGSGGGGGGVTGSGSQPSYAGGDGSAGVVIVRYNPAEITATGGIITEVDVQDTKPTNVQVGSRFEETDTRKMYHYEAGDPTYETDFSSSTGWTLGQMSISNNNPSGTVASSGSMTYSNIASSNISDDTWNMRFGLKITATNTGSLNPLFVGLADSTAIGSSTFAAGDHLGFIIYTSDSLPYNLRAVNGGSSVDYIRSSSTPVTNTQYYVEIIKDGANSSLRFYDSSDFTDSGSSLPLLQGTNAGSVNAFDYFMVKPYNTGSGSHTIEITDLKIYSGVTTASMPNVWKEEGT